MHLTLNLLYFTNGLSFEFLVHITFCYGQDENDNAFHVVLSPPSYFFPLVLEKLFIKMTIGKPCHKDISCH